MSWWEIFIYLWNDKLLHDYWKKFLSDGITTSSSPETSTSAKYTFQQKTNETIIITVIIKAEKRHFSWHKKWATRMKGPYTTELWRKPLKYFGTYGSLWCVSFKMTFYSKFGFLNDEFGVLEVSTDAWQMF